MIVIVARSPQIVFQSPFVVRTFDMSTLVVFMLPPFPVSSRTMRTATLETNEAIAKN